MLPALAPLAVGLLLPNRGLWHSTRVREGAVAVGCSAIFPEEGEQSDNRRAAIAEQDLVGFWTIYDEQASQDAMGRMTTGAEVGSIFSSRMVLRADGQTSRGSDFPGGNWELVSEESSRRKRMRLTLRNRAKREEWRYDGLVFWLETSAAPPGVDPSDLLAKSVLEASAGVAEVGEEDPKLELRVVGKAGRWDMSDEGAARRLGEGRFSMIKLDVSVASR